MTGTEPLADAMAEGNRVIETAVDRDLLVRLIGGTAILTHAETRAEEPFTRDYRDIDFVTLREDKKAVIELMLELGYEENKQINRMHRYRMEFWDPVNERKADYIVDRFEFCHAWGLRDRLDLDEPTIPIEDLLLSKLQIYEISDRDIRDILAMLHDHPVEASDDRERIDPAYIASLCSDDWGLYKTVTINLERVTNFLESHSPPIDADIVTDRINELSAAIEREPKSLKWKLRSVVGERKRWYQRPELT